MQGQPVLNAVSAHKKTRLSAAFQSSCWTATGRVLEWEAKLTRLCEFDPTSRPIVGWLRAGDS